VFVDAPLIVTNEDKQRLCEKHVGQRYWKAKVSANSTNINSRHLGGVALRKALQQAGFVYDDGLDGPPQSGRVVSECFPYTTIVGYEPFGYDERPRYKRAPKKMRTAEFKPKGLKPAMVSSSGSQHYVTRTRPWTSVRITAHKSCSTDHLR